MNTSFAPFNGPIEVGLRSLSVLTAAFPDAFSMQRLVVMDYLLVHSDDVPNGPAGLHPKTPHRSGEILVRRAALQEGLMLYQSRGLVERKYLDGGVYYVATERSASFLDTLDSAYANDLRQRADWVVERFSRSNDTELGSFVAGHVGVWGAEFSMESVLQAEEAS